MSPLALQVSRFRDKGYAFAFAIRVPELDDRPFTEADAQNLADQCVAAIRRADEACTRRQSTMNKRV